MAALVLLVVARVDAEGDEAAAEPAADEAEHEAEDPGESALLDLDLGHARVSAELACHYHWVVRPVVRWVCAVPVRVDLVHDVNHLLALHRHARGSHTGGSHAWGRRHLSRHTAGSGCRHRLAWRANGHTLAHDGLLVGLLRRILSLVRRGSVAWLLLRLHERLLLGNGLARGDAGIFGDLLLSVHLLVLIIIIILGNH